MSVIPSGVSVQEIYRRYRENQIVVNRKYQRKLVWSETEKVCLIDSILKGYPIPLILFAEYAGEDGRTYYEVLDGMQRLNAIVGFLENEYPVNQKYFDIKQLARVQQAESEGLFVGYHGEAVHTPQICANLLDYQLAVTSYKVESEENVFEIFRRINSGGRQLSSQEQRQAGVLCHFSDLVREIAADIRGDSTNEQVVLSDMPQISIGNTRENCRYGLNADNTFWVKQGIIAIQNLRDSDDEEIIADILISILLGEPFARSKERLDKAYDLSSDLYSQIEIALIRYTPEKLKSDVQNTFSVLKNCIESVSTEANYLRSVVMPAARIPIKNAFYTIFMALYDLLVKEDLSPFDNAGLFNSLHNLQSRIKVDTHYATTENRKQNIALTKGLMLPFFVKKEPSALSHGSGLALDFENSIRRSKIETPRYEFKQGLLRLSNDRKYDKALEEQILKTICAIANVGSKSEGYIFIGVADKEADAKRIQELDSILPVTISNHSIVGIDREAAVLGITLEDYCRRIVGFIKTSSLSDSLISSVLSNIDIIDYRSMSVIRIKVPPQTEISYYGDEVYERQYNNTVKVESPKAVMSIAKRFS
jgi:uncharacterized protein with ParB-like and HNH nuclease domain